jgi:hypothetical protein
VQQSRSPEQALRPLSCCAPAVHSGVLFAVTADDLERLAAVRKFVDWTAATEEGVRASLGSLRLRLVDEVAADAGIIPAVLGLADGNDGRPIDLALQCGILYRDMRFDNRKNPLYEAQKDIAFDYDLNLAG